VTSAAGSATGPAPPGKGGVRAAIVLLLLVPILVPMFAAMLIWLSERNASSAAEERVLSAARISAANVRLLVESALDRLARIDDELGPDPAKFILRSQREGEAFIALYDASGASIGRDGTRGASVSDNADFKALASGKPWVITPLLGGQGSPIRLFGIGKRIDREGQFGGSLTAYYPADQLSDLWASLALGADSTVTLLREDGAIVTRYPVPDEPGNIRDNELFTHHLPAAPSGVYRAAATPDDGKPSIVAYESLKDLGLVVGTSILQTQDQSEFWSRVASTSMVAAPVFLALLILCIWAILLLLRHDRSRTELQAALAQNRVLFQEIHHRVKNNLQAVASLVRLQQAPPEMKDDLIRRISAMSAVHQHIYESDQFGDVEASGYLSRLLAGLKESAPPGVSLEWKLDPVMVSPDQALPLGLLVNELVANAFKHAFPAGRSGPDPGKVSVTLGTEKAEGADTALLVVSDNGVGQPLETAPSTKSGIGSRLIAGFVSQLQGETKVRHIDGVTFELRFPLET
jgi:two-component system, sensor histidine kinase PdtaS